LSIGGMMTAQEFSQIMLKPVFAIPNAARRLSSPQNRITILLLVVTGFSRNSLKFGPAAILAEPCQIQCILFTCLLGHTGPRNVVNLGKGLDKRSAAIFPYRIAGLHIYQAPLKVEHRACAAFVLVSHADSN